MAGLLWGLGTAGFQEKQAGGELRIEAYFPAGQDPSGLLQDIELGAVQAGLRLNRLQAESFQEDPQAWLENWRQNFRAFAVGETFYVHPPWEAPDPAYPVPLILEPSRAFGTGTHESTQLCLLALRRQALQCRSLLDVGTGSGILSVASLMLNPGLKAVALDSDPDAVEVAVQTRQRHQIDPAAMAIVCGQLTALSGCFDLVVANLTLAIFRCLSHELIRVVDRRLLVSGFTSDQQGQVLELFLAQAGLRLEQRQHMNGWSCLLLTRE